MKTFKTYSAARKHANGTPVIRLGKFYIAAPELDAIQLALTEVELLDKNGNPAGHITMRHLDRLGNGNHAVAMPNKVEGSNVFPPHIFK